MDTIIVGGDEITVHDSTVVLLKLVNGEPLNDDELIYTEEIGRDHLLTLARTGKVDVASVLYDVCDAKHASCVGCPVRDLLAENDDCSCFKDGNAMLKFLKYKAKNLR